MELRFIQFVLLLYNLFPPDKCSQCKRERSRTDLSRARTLSASFGLLDGPDLGGERVDVVLGAGPPPASHVPRVHVGPTVEGGRVEAVTPSVVVRPQLPPTPPSTMASAAGGCDGGGVALLAAPLVADQLKCRVVRDDGCLTNCLGVGPLLLWVTLTCPSAFTALRSKGRLFSTKKLFST